MRKIKTAMLLLSVVCIVCPISVQATDNVINNNGIVSVEQPVGDTALTPPSTQNSGVSSGFLDGLKSAMGGAVSEEDTAVRDKVSSTAGVLSNRVIQFVIGVIPAAIFAITAVEIACLMINIVRSIFGDTISETNATGMGGSGNKKKLQFLSDDYHKAIRECCGSGGGSGSMDGGMGGDKGSGMFAKNLLLTYAKYKSVTIILAFTIILLFLTPMGIAFFSTVMDLISKIFGQGLGKFQEFVNGI